jgi:hypothetical protein
MYYRYYVSGICTFGLYFFYHCISDFNLAYLQRHGFSTPLLFRDKVGLGLRVPSPNFSVNDVRMCVGEYFYVIAMN